MAGNSYCSVRDIKYMKKSKLWGFLAIFSVVLSIAIFVLHYKLHLPKSTRDQFVSGFYYKTVPMDNLAGMEMKREAKMGERQNGFSLSNSEKGIFFDSITNKNVYAFIDNWKLPK